MADSELPDCIVRGGRAARATLSLAYSAPSRAERPCGAAREGLGTRSMLRSGPAGLQYPPRGLRVEEEGGLRSRPEPQASRYRVPWVMYYHVLPCNTSYLKKSADSGPPWSW